MAELPLIRFARHAALATAAFVTPPIALAAQSASAPADFVPAHDTLIIASHALGETRPIHVHVPRGYSRSSSRRFPVLYMPDGGIDEDFPHVVNTVDSLIALGRIRPVIVVGIPNTQRRRDLTGPTRVAKDSTIAPRVGGSRAFRRFIRDELIPVIDARYRTTRERSIVGESLAGLFVLETFLTEPTLFDRYVAFDPSLWWNGGALVADASRHLANAPTGQRSAFVAASKDDIDALTARLDSLVSRASPPRLRWRYVPRPDLTHATIFRAMAPTALADMLR